MKRNTLLILALAAALVGCTTGCKSTPAATLQNPTPTPVFDPAKTKQVTDAGETIIRVVTRRVILNSPEHPVVIANYFRGVAGVFCEMKNTGHFDPTTLSAGLNGVLPPKLANNETIEFVLDFKPILEGLYKQFWGARLSADLPPDKWAYQLALVFCNSIDAGLKDAGQPGVN